MKIINAQDIGHLSHKKFESSKSKGREFGIRVDEEKEPVDPFLLDCCKLLDSKGLRRLQNKTQVFIFPQNPHVRTRMTHSNEVVALSIKIAHLLGLNEYLCQAISLGHDIGHVPYGHTGERFIGSVLGKKFRHEIFGTVLCRFIERKGSGLNLCYETLEGIFHHSSKDGTQSDIGHEVLEYKVVFFADKIAYTFADMNDFVRYRNFDESSLPKSVLKLGRNQRERVASCVHALVKESIEKEMISFSDCEEAVLFDEIRRWMFENMYHKEREDELKLALSLTYEYLSQESRFNEIQPALLLALMTDKELSEIMNIIFTSRSIQYYDIRNFGFVEIVPHLLGKNIDMCSFNYPST